MGGKRRRDPKDSEIPIGEWFEQIGATEIQFVGRDGGGGPPDYVIKYKGEKIAAEACLLHDSKGWDRRTKHAFEEKLGKLIEDESKKEENMSWHSSCEYDPRQLRSSISNSGIWSENARRALNTPGLGGEFQLLPAEKVVGRGVALTLIPASNEGGFSGVAADDGCIVAQTLSEQIVVGVGKKAIKIRDGERSEAYNRWWLIFDDEILIAPIGTLTMKERSTIENRVRECEGREQWSKIVMVSRFQIPGSPPKSLKWFHALWEDPRHPPLPASS